MSQVETMAEVPSTEQRLVPRAAATGRWLSLGERFGLLAIFLAVVVVFSITQGDTFATSSNWRVIVSSQAVVALIALAVMVPLIAGNFDLSVGSIAIMCSIATAGAMSHHGWALAPSCVLAVAIGTAVGLVNGLLVTRAGLNGLIATLGTATVIGGLISWYTKDLSISGGISPALTKFGTGNILGVPKITVIAVVAALAVAYLLTQTPFGRRLTAIGSSREASTLVGVRVDRLTLLTFIISGALAGVAGVLMLAVQGSANSATNGIGIMLPALAAVYLGASAFAPGQFNVLGTLLGLVLVATVVSGLTLSGAQPWVEPVFNGLALIVAVGVSAAFRRQRLGSA